MGALFTTVSSIRVSRVRVTLTVTVRVSRVSVRVSVRGRCPLRSLVTSVPGHFGPKTELDIQFGPWSLRSLVTSALRTELT